MAENGFVIETKDVRDLMSVKAEHRIPQALQSCHTAIVDGYIIEGHVPAADVKRLLAERPDVAGLAVPGMPIGSPGMAVQGHTPESFDVVAFDAAGATDIYASYDGE